MNFLSGYGSDEDAEVEAPSLSTEHRNTNPVVSSTALSTSIVSHKDRDTSGIIVGNMVMTNPRIEEMCAPTLGPSHPYKLNSAAVTSNKKVGMGYIEEAQLDNGTFDEQYKTFLKSGYAMDASTNAVLGDAAQYERDMQPPLKRRLVGGLSKKEEALEKRAKAMEKIMQTVLKEESEAAGGGAVVNGPWAESAAAPTPLLLQNAKAEDKKKAATAASGGGAEAGSDDEEDSNRDPTMHIVEPDEEEEKWERVNERKRTFNTLPPRPARGTVAADATSTFHGPRSMNPQASASSSSSSGASPTVRSWVLPPLGVKPEDRALHPDSHDCFIPKKCIKKFTGHTKGVQAIELFPDTGHLVLSASMDGQCKMWGLYDDDGEGGRALRRTYNGHTEGVRSIQFNNSGSQFLSSAFDRYMRLWDVESGVAVGTFSNRKMGYQAKFTPNDNNVFLMAASDNKVYQWDIRTGGVVLEYNYHLAQCNSVTYFDEGRKFMTTSDDKKVLVWELNTPVPLKYVTDESLQNIPTLTTHPSNSIIAGQSMDNTIVCFSTANASIKPFKKKVFKGHNSSGYACQIGFSPNGKYMISGDGFGTMHVWDWKSGKIFRKIHAHDGGPCIGAQWHPLQPSWVVTCGWDGVIKLWD